MGIIKRGILGGFAGSVANVVGTSWKGIAVMKSKPLSVANPRSAGQTAQRTRFSSIVELAKSVLSSICIPVWNGFASQMSGYNMFIQRNVANAFSSVGVFQPSNLVIAPKSGTPTETLTADPGEGDEAVTVQWSGTIDNTEQMDTDKCIILITTQDGIVLGSDFGGAVRSSQQRIVNINQPIVETQILHIFLSFASADGKRTFDTQWLQVVVTA